MTTRSLILHAHEIRAALAGTLEMVVRPVKCIGINTFTSVRLSSFHSIWGPNAWIFETPMDKDVTGYEAMSRGMPCPLGVFGTRLCCKETWGQDMSTVYYQASADDLDMKWIRWRSPATMPAWASRITLEVVGVRCVRLHQLCEDDMRKAYGISMATPASHDFYKQLRTSFESVWNAHYAKRGLGWEKNPWAWAVEVRRVGG